MAKTENIKVRIEPETKMQAVELFDSLGMTVSDAITIFLRQSINAGGLPFRVEVTPAGKKRGIVKQTQVN